VIQLDEVIVSQLKEAADGVAVETRLKTDEQVIARVTDGIYRQPSSAFRELIANAYDADATRVSVKTDAPRFKRITIEDDGNGMGEEALVNLCHHIGGSAKRRDLGGSMGIALQTDPLLSPGGRRLIGKIGIGLFSVSQLTRKFHIITKARKSPQRLVASVVMRQFDGKSGEVEYESGIVKLWRETVSDVDAHGTTIVLDGVREQARQTLSSASFWMSLKQARENEPGARLLLRVPNYFIGSSEIQTEIAILADVPGMESQSLPWLPEEAPLEKFRNLVSSVWDEADHGNSNARLDSIFDTYLRAVWQLGLAVPLQYVDGHPYDQDGEGWERVFAVSNLQRGSSIPVELSRTETPRSKLFLSDGSDALDFTVVFDGLELRRPLRFKGLPKSNSRIEKPLMFFGKCEELFVNHAEEFTAGPLRFEAYLMWAPKILPVDHQGVLIRINGASGTLFDTSFMKYQTAEIVRMRQISCEIFVQEGLEAALNIDRESLNEAHPHTVFLAQWLHNALRQVTSRQKQLAAEVRTEQRGEKQDERIERISRIVENVRDEVAGSNSDSLPTVIIASPTLENSIADYVIDDSVFHVRDSGRETPTHQMRIATLRKKTEAIANILAAYGLFNHIDVGQRSSVVKAIYEILSEGDEPNE
jgi:Histidine kinase-, DNA gyrase B-, and HSP90-like ATPase